MLLRLAAERRVLFVGGKGGVGKTSVASAVALERARDGGRVLVVSTDPAHNLGHLWDRPLGDEPTTVVAVADGARAGGGAARVDGRGGGVDAVEIDPARTVETHLAGVRSTMLRLLPERLHGQVEQHLAFAREAPGTYESAILDRLAECVEAGLDAYDLVVVDTAPTGHTLRLLALPAQLTSWTETLLASRDRAERFGAAVRGLGGRRAADVDVDAELRRVLVRRRRRFATLRDVVGDPGRTSFVIVGVAEPMPVAESLALDAELASLGVDVSAVVVNRRSPADAGELLAQRRRAEDQQLRVLRAGLEAGSGARAGGGPDVVELPLLAGDLVGEPGVAAIGAAIRAAG
ncbi:arsenite-transporting ATPase [Mumia flava]|uniref:Arsenite-transporting ATPase n=1 Tax=Mumia flava TaxID=1348852 RepID=A0A0B2B0C3_9ACTN|nr:ArsA family ATPase [Mumia flava]PJJ56653.1 arsenite-transporting ATPase [Mumia flava]